MRRKKFKIYDSDIKEWLTDVSVYEEGSFQGTCSLSTDRDSQTCAGMKLYEDTGLDDYNDKPIYSNYKVKIRNHPAGGGTVGLFEGAFWVFAKNGTPIGMLCDFRYHPDGNLIEVKTETE